MLFDKVVARNTASAQAVHLGVHSMQKHRLKEPVLCYKTALLQNYRVSRSWVWKPPSAPSGTRAATVLTAPLAIVRGKALIVAADRLFNALASTLGHVAGVTRALLAHLVGPTTECPVFLPRARQQRADHEARRQAHNANEDRVLLNKALDAMPG